MVMILKIGLLELPYVPYHILRYYNIVNKEFLLNKNHDFRNDDDLKYFEIYKATPMDKESNGISAVVILS